MQGTDSPACPLAGRVNSGRTDRSGSYWKAFFRLVKLTGVRGRGEVFLRSDS